MIASMAFDIRVDDVRQPQVIALLQEHVASAVANSPQGAVHALDLDALCAPDITFWCVWQQQELAGIGALRELDPAHGEIKSMRTATPYLRQGVGQLVLTEILRVATERGYRRLSLETGRTAPFAAARSLYRRFGFAQCAPFGNYVDDGFSICMSRELP